MADSGLTSRLIVGAGWLVAGKALERGLGVVSTLILARLLVPEHFGLVAMAAPIVGIVELIGGLNVDSAVIGSRRRDSAILNSAWSLRLASAVLMTVALIALARPAAAIYDEPRIEMIVYCLAIGVFVQGFENIGLVTFRQRVDMWRDVALLLGKKLCAVLITAALALWGAGYWSLIAGIVASRILGVGLSFALSDYRPRWQFSDARALLSFSGWLFLANAFHMFNFRTPEFVLGKSFGAEAVALYAIAYEIAAVATGELSAAVSRATFPAFAEVAADRERLRIAISRVVASVAAIALPAGVGIHVVAPTLVPVLLGERWMGCIWLMSHLALVWSVMAVLNQIGYVYLALDRPRAGTLIAGGYTALLVVAIAVVVPKGGLHALPAIYAALLIYLVIANGVLMRRLAIGFGLAQWWRALWRPMIGCAAMYAVLLGLDARFATPSMGKLVSLIAIGAGAYLSVLALLWVLSGRPDGLEKQLLARIARRVT